VNRLKAGALAVSLNMREGSVPVKPPLNEDGELMTMKEICEAYKRDFDANDPARKGFGANSPHTRLFAWDHQKRDWWGKPLMPWTNMKFERWADNSGLGDWAPNVLTGTATGCDIPAVVLYTKETGGTYYQLNTLLSRTPTKLLRRDNDAHKRLVEYNQDTKHGSAGSALKPVHKYWWYAFSLMYHIIAEMQLRNAHLAAAKAIREETIKKRWYEKELVVYQHTGAEEQADRDVGTFRGVAWTKPMSTALDERGPSELYRGMCAAWHQPTFGRRLNPKFTAEFYAKAWKSKEEFSYQGFTSTSEKRDVALKFANGAHGKCTRTPLIFKIHKMDATPTFLDATMSALSKEAEYLFPPHSFFKVRSKPAQCRDAQARRKLGKKWRISMCVELEYVGSDGTITIDSDAKSSSTLEVKAAGC
jgi:hypothetical protein